MYIFVFTNRQYEEILLAIKCNWWVGINLNKNVIKKQVGVIIIISTTFLLKRQGREQMTFW